MAFTNPFDLTGKVALVTGGNQGIGFGAARALASAGAAVAIWGRRAHQNEEAIKLLAEYGNPVHSEVVDVADAEQIRAGFAGTLAALGRIDTVFASAGISKHADSFLDITPEVRDEVLGINLLGAWETLQCAVRHMVERAEAGDPGGSIIANGSLSVFRGLPGGEHYGAAKAGLSVVIKGIATKYGSIGIRANMICPGFIEKSYKKGRHDQRLLERGPIPRVGQPDDLGGIIVYLASDASAYHTGDVITIDGGWTANGT